MAGKGILGSERIIEAHQPISKDLGDNGGAADDHTPLVSMHDRPTGLFNLRRDRTVNENKIGANGEMVQRLLHGSSSRLKDVPPVNLFSAENADTHSRLLEDRVKRLLALEGGEPF